MAFLVVNTATNSWTHVSHLDSGELGLLQLPAECGRWVWGARGAGGDHATEPGSSEALCWGASWPARPSSGCKQGAAISTTRKRRLRKVVPAWNRLHRVVYSQSWGRPGTVGLQNSLFHSCFEQEPWWPKCTPLAPPLVSLDCRLWLTLQHWSFPLSQPENMFSINRWVKMERSICLASVLRGVLCYIHTYLCKSFKQCVFQCGFYFLSHSTLFFGT